MDLSGAAFPCEGRGIQWDGLTKRELYAAMAMQGLLAHTCDKTTGDESAEDIALRSRKMADALIEALAKGKK